MQLGELVVGEIQAGEARLLQIVDQVLFIAAAAGLHPHEDVGTAGIRQPIAEFGEVALPQQRAERAQTPCPLWDFHRQHRFAVFADLRALRHEAQTIEVHVGATGHCHQGLAMAAASGHIGLHAGHRQRPRRLEDRTGVLENVLDGGTDGIGVHGDHRVHMAACQLEGLDPHLPHGDAVGEQAHLLQLHPFPQR